MSTAKVCSPHSAPRGTKHYGVVKVVNGEATLNLLPSLAPLEATITTAPSETRLY